MLSSQEILRKYLDFFGKHGHKEIPNVSVVPQEDSTLLFVNSGMFPLVPYLMGQPHPLGKRLMNVQRSIRFQDMDEVGKDIRHTTAFHMIGNWSLGDYFKKEQLNWIYEFFVEVLGLDINRLYATVFKGEGNIPRDEESIEILTKIFEKYGIKARLNERIFEFGKESNWWQRGDAVGELGGPDSEVFYWLLDRPPKPNENPETAEDYFLEIGNSVFMQYIKTERGWKELPQKNVDFGGGLERIAMIVQGKSDIFLTDMFEPLIQAISELTNKPYEEYKKEFRIIADHMRASVIIGMDGVIPSNKEQGYVLRRLLRRMFRFAHKLGAESDIVIKLVKPTVDMLDWLYPWWHEKERELTRIFDEEEKRFTRTLKRVLPKVEKIIDKIKTTQLNTEEIAKYAFDLYQSEGYPPEMFYEELEHYEIEIEKETFENAYQKLYTQHQEISRKGATKKFKGGLAEHTETTIRYHTATHLLHAALYTLIDPNIYQKGSNITNERLRFDFPLNRDLTEEEIKKLEDWVNERINEGLPVNYVIMDKEEAKKIAKYIPGEEYPEKVKVYYIGNDLKSAISREFCGGPHVKNTKEIPPIEIYRQENLGGGVRRLYARFKTS